VKIATHDHERCSNKPGRRFLLITVLTVVLALSSAQNAFATMGLAYDNGIWGTAYNGYTYAGVRFSLPDGASSARLKYVRWSDYYPSPALTIHITGPDHVTELSGSPIAQPGGDPAGTGCPAGWPACYGLDLTSYNIVVTGDFFVILQKTGGGIELDSSVSSSGRSFAGTSLATLTTPSNLNLLIRVDVDPTYPASYTLYSVNVFVKDSATGRGIEGASIVFDGTTQPGTSNVMGLLTVTGIGPGTHIATASKTGYSAPVLTFYVTRSTSVTVRLTSTVATNTVTVQVYNSVHTSTPIGSAMVYVDHAYAGTTDTAGHLPLTLTAGTHMFTVMCSGYITNTQTSSSTTVTIYLTPR
jgi:hypothetical protein